MSYRYINDVGYKKIYPMSFCEDDTFCHYCGRYPSPGNGLEWDHVPALNVKIPEECNEIRKTLVRSCRECNSLASDIAHLDYIERHFWLKGAYLRRYKKVLVNEGDYGEESDYDSLLLRGVISNAKKSYEEILYAIGFGVKSIDEIESPILKLKTKSKKKISSLLLDYISGVPSDDECDEVIYQSDKFEKENEDDAQESEICSYSEFNDFLLAEYSSGCKMDSQESYMYWVKDHPSRFKMLKLPEDPLLEYGISWSDMALNASESLSKEKADHFFQWNSECCSYDNFIEFLKYELAAEEFEEEKDYQAWLIDNELIALENNLPKYPSFSYELEWSLIKKEALIKKKNSKYLY